MNENNNIKFNKAMEFYNERRKLISKHRNTFIKKYAEYKEIQKKIEKFKSEGTLEENKLQIIEKLKNIKHSLL